MKARKRVVTSVERPGGWPAPRRDGRPPATVRPGAHLGPAPRPAGRGGSGNPGGSGVAAMSVPVEPAVEAAPDLTVDLGRGLLLRNPLLVASGAMGFGLELDDLVEPERIGALCTRGITLRARTVNPPTRYR